MTRSHVTLAAVLLAAAITESTTLRAQARPQVELRTAIELEESKGDIKGAIEHYKRLSENRDRAVAAQALMRLANAYQRIGDLRAREFYERIIRDFGDQRDVSADAHRRLRTFTDGDIAPTARRMVPIWTGDEVGGGRPSQDGRYIAFQWGTTGDLAVRDLKTNTTRRLTNTGGWVASGDYATDAVISPDNRFIAYSWFIEAEGVTELRTIPMASEPATPRTLIRTEERYVLPMAWTPDSSQVIVSRLLLGAWQLGLVHVHDGRYVTLKSLEWRNPSRGISLSPDGRLLAYQTPAGERGSPMDIVVLAVDGSREGVAVSGPTDDFDPRWSPDGSQLVFLRNDAGSTGLWALPMREGRPAGPAVLVKSDTTQMRPLSITRDGALIYGVPGTARRNVHVGPLKGLISSAPPVVVAGHAVDASAGPAWSRDGESLTYWSLKPKPSLVIRSIRNGQERTIALPPRAFMTTSPIWFPDGRSLLLSVGAAQGRGAGFARFDIDTGTVEMLHQSPLTDNEVVSIALAPDAGAIYWAVQSTQLIAAPSGRLLRFDLKTQQELELKRGDWFLAMALSPDGKELAYLKNVRIGKDRKEAPGILEIIPATGGAARQVFRDPIWYSGNRYSTLAWTPDQQNLIAVRDDGALWRFPVNGGTPQKMGLAGTSHDFTPGKVPPNISVEREIKAPAIHPDGSTIAYTLKEAEGYEIWKYENFLAPAAVRK